MFSSTPSESSFSYRAGASAQVTVSPGGTMSFPSQQHQFNSFQEFQDDVVGQWMLVDSDGNFATFEVESFEKNDFPTIENVTPMDGDQFEDETFVPVSFATSTGFFFWGISFDSDLIFVSMGFTGITGFLEDGVIEAPVIIQAATTENFADFITNVDTSAVSFNVVTSPPIQTNASRIEITFRQSVIVPPDSYNVFRGVEIKGSVGDFADSDDLRARYNPGFTINDTEAPVWLEFFADAPGASGFRVESNAGTPGLEYTVEAFNWANGSYEVIGVQPESFQFDQLVQFPVVPDDHIDTDGSVRARVGWRQVGFIINFPWEVLVNQTGWE